MRLNPIQSAVARPSVRRGLRSPRRSRGFSLIEIMMALAIGSIAIAVAIPKVKKAEASSRATIVVADLRTFAAAFEAYAQEHGSWPAEVAAGVMPTEMSDRLGSTGWLRVTPLGGQYNWEADQMHGGVRYRAAICISETASAPLVVNEELWLEMDRLIDDGNLSTGNFRTGVNNDPLYIIQQ
jgi:prepilin-type N-terminal cleavage/methylation domain-containing protein